MVGHDIYKNGLVTGLGNITGLRAIGDFIYTDWEHAILIHDQITELSGKMLVSIEKLKEKLKHGTLDEKGRKKYSRMINILRIYYGELDPDDPLAQAILKELAIAEKLGFAEDIKHGDPTFIQIDREDEEE